MKLRISKLFKNLGPGIVSGAADDDPSGIATYAQAGAMFGPVLLWTSAYILPLVFAVQEIAARIGLVTGKGIAKNLKEHYPRPLLYLIVTLLVIANTVNLGVDLGAIATSIQLIAPINFDVLLTSVTVLIVGLEVFTSYKQYSNVLKWLAFSLLAYIITGFFIHTDWNTVFRYSLIPHIEFGTAYIFAFVGIMGTTISPYVMFWQANEEVEEEMDKRILKRSGGLPHVTKRVIHKMRWDTLFGMFLSGITAWFIILTAANTLFPNGIHTIETAAQAAKALEPLVQTFPNSGYIAKLLFSLGVIGTGLLAVPIFAASNSYAISEVFGWKEGLNNKLKRAKSFYVTIVLSTIIGVLSNYLGINPMQALVYTAVLNGVISVPIIACIISIANNKAIMGEYKTPWVINLLAGVTFVAMLFGAIGVIIPLFQ